MRVGQNRCPAQPELAARRLCQLGGSGIWVPTQDRPRTARGRFWCAYKLGGRALVRPVVAHSKGGTRWARGPHDRPRRFDLTGSTPMAPPALCAGGAIGVLLFWPAKKPGSMVAAVK